MAPEQARGEGERLDWRADVYSLGATLYHLLTGKLPIPGENSLKVLSNIASVEPVPPRVHTPAIPADLEAIVLKCLEKERSARYDSVLALIEDLDRFLTGEPVKARATGAGYRLYKRVRKHQRLVAVSAVALLAVACALGWALFTRSQAAQREELARSFTEKVERIESLARLSALAPLHDTRKDRAALHGRLEALETEIRQAGALAVGPGRYALGRGYLALGQEERAREQLEAAWRAGFREPRVASALALVLSRLYRQQRLEAARLAIIQSRGGQPPPQATGAASGLDKQKLEKLYREPALEYLRLSQGAAEFSPAWMAALLAFYDEQFDEALAQLDTMDAAEPWAYEALQLRGDIFRVRASRRTSVGDFKGAREDFAAGRQAYAAAAEIGRSEFAISLAQGELEATQLIMELYHSGETQAPFLRGLEAVARARAIAPDSVEALLQEAHLYQRAAEHKVNQRSETEAGELLQKARSRAEQALRLSPGAVGARIELGQQFALEARSLTQGGKDPREQLRQALMHFEQVPPEDRTASFEVHLGLLFAAWAEYELTTGGQPLPYLDKAIAAYHQATQRDGALRAAWLNLGKTYLERERRRDNPDRDGDLEKARHALTQARALGPENIVAAYYMGWVHERSAARSKARGADARPDWANARKQYEDAIAINDKAAYLHDRLGYVLLELAREEWLRGGDPFALLDRAQASYERAFTVAPGFFTARTNMSDALVQRALYQRARGASPEASLRAALAALNSARKSMEHRWTFWTNLGTVYVLMARFEVEQGRDPSQTLLRAGEALDKALSMEKGEAQIWLYRGQLQLLRSQRQAQRGQAWGFEQITRDFQEAVRLAAETYHSQEPDYRLAFAEFCCEWASMQRRAGGSPEQALRLGLEQVKTVLASLPDAPEAIRLRSCLCAGTASCP
jgi:serine/threonine-protein kinase